MPKKSRDPIHEIKHGIIDFDEVGYFRYNLSLQDKLALKPRLNNVKNEKLFCNPFPENFKKLCTGMHVIPEELSPYKEVLLYLETLIFYKEELSIYINQRKTLESAILLGDVNSYLDIIEKIEDKFGTSLYLIQIEMYANVVLENKIDNKEWLKDLTKDEDNPKSSIVLEFARARIDGMKAWEYNAYVQQHKKLYDSDSAKLIDYIDFRLDPLNLDIPFSNLAFILNFDYNFSLIDRYDTLRNLLPRIIPNLNGYELANTLELCNILCIKIKDNYWTKLQLIYRNEGKISFPICNENNIYYESLDLYYNKCYIETINIIKSALKIDSTQSELYIIFVKCIILLDYNIDDHFDVGTEINRILQILYKTLMKTNTYEVDREKFQEIYIQSSHCKFAEGLTDILYYEYTIDIPKAVREFSFLTTGSIHDNFFHNVVEEYKVVEILEKSKCKAFNFLKTLDDLVDDKYEGPFYHILAANYFLSKKEYSKCLNEINKIKEFEWCGSKPSFVSTWTIKAEIKALVNSDKYDLACEIIAGNYFQNGKMYDHYISISMFEKLLNLDNQNLYSEISIPIAFHLSKQPNQDIYDAFANYLVQKGYRIPSDMLSDNNAPSQYLFYFLREVCREEVIQSSPFLNSIHDVQTERIKILNYLKKHDGLNESSYNEEILEMTRMDSIRRGLKQINSSRIYIDDLNIRKKFSEELEDLYVKYIELDNSDGIEMNVRLGFDGISSMNVPTFYLKDILKYSSTIEHENIEPSNIVYVNPLKPIWFLNIITSIKDWFILDEDFGFKSFLSMRIRHGTFLNIFRSVFEKFQLLNNSNSTFKLGLEPEDFNYVKVDNLIRTFTEDIDGIIDTNLKIINVKVDLTDENALFDFNFTQNRLFDLYTKRFGRLESLNEVVDDCFAFLYEVLNLYLAHVRDTILPNMVGEFTTKLDSLQTELSELIEDFHIIDEKIVTCKTEIQLTAHEVSNWFNVSTLQHLDQFDMNLLIDTSIKYTDIVYNQLLTRCNVKLDIQFGRLIDGKYFTYFGDIFNNLLDNILKHNKELDDKLIINIVVLEKEENLVILVSNNLIPDYDLKKIEQEIYESKQKISSYKSGSPVSYEYKSGYPKICKCISVDLQMSNFFVEPSLSDDMYYVHISFPYKNISI